LKGLLALEWAIDEAISSLTNPLQEVVWPGSPALRSCHLGSRSGGARIVPSSVVPHEENSKRWGSPSGRSWIQPGFPLEFPWNFCRFRDNL